jgi:hypothetical protein
MFGSKPKTNKITSPLMKGDHPKIDDSAFLEEVGIQQYQPSTTSMSNIAGEIRNCSCYHDNVSIQICTKEGTS